jgi:hypothetical protein
MYSPQAEVGLRRSKNHVKRRGGVSPSPLTSLIKNVPALMVFALGDYSSVAPGGISRSKRHFSTGFLAFK